MDVLKPELIWVDGRCYRLFESNTWANNSNLNSYMEEDYQADYTDEELDDADIDIIPHSESKFEHTFHVAKVFYPFIIGTKNATRKRIEIETKTSIQIPKADQDGDIVIIGSERRGIISARHRIDLIIEMSRKKLQYTHFISIPMGTDKVIANFNMFRTNVLEKFANRVKGIDEKIFQKPHKLHITIEMLQLLDEEERKQAVKVFRECEEHIVIPFIESHSLVEMKLQGLEYMNDDPTNVNVLYAKVHTENNILQELVDQVAKYFIDAGLIPKSSGRESVKLHVTLMNTHFRKKLEIKGDKTFDATQILEEYKDITLGIVPLKEIHLSQLHTAINEYYKATAKIVINNK